jgi:S-adenosylmethionine-diacylgycerolhomoserine-N-methlytransferase
MGVLNDIRVLFHMATASNRGRSHAERLEGFYSGQAGDYDAFRRRLLHGRERLFSQLDPPEGGVWFDLGGGTGTSLEFMGDKLARLDHACVVDLAPSLLARARERIAERGWANADTAEADVTTFQSPHGRADLVTFSYSLTMIPDWFAAIDHARALLKPGGTLAVVDFFVARKHPDPGRTRHPWRTRAFWPLWFATDNVFLSADHLPYLARRFSPRLVEECRGTVPYMPLARAPYYLFIGEKTD